MKQRKLHVKRVSHSKLQKKWGFKVPLLPGNQLLDPLFIRCNKDGEINWDKAPVYSVEELAERNNVQILN